MMGGEISAVTAVRCRYGSSSDGSPGPHGERRRYPVIVREVIPEWAIKDEVGCCGSLAGFHGFEVRADNFLFGF